MVAGGLSIFFIPKQPMCEQWSRWGEGSEGERKLHKGWRDTETANVKTRCSLLHPAFALHNAITRICKVCFLFFIFNSSNYNIIHLKVSRNNYIYFRLHLSCPREMHWSSLVHSFFIFDRINFRKVTLSNKMFCICNLFPPVFLSLFREFISPINFDFNLIYAVANYF